ncbi:hypothetical protein GUJ93_ZPchr0152g29217 [Zizania palustris]|uniref:Uncharacterized protein n=1 Tax=Zizania palustris TaxID=103762 RepID=A0A8J5V369_ZIZPA|nr:hypothetical protein GUJ93_ZPchr0152g29217 [Zizania palustris]
MATARLGNWGKGFDGSGLHWNNRVKKSEAKTVTLFASSPLCTLDIKHRTNNLLLDIQHRTTVSRPAWSQPAEVAWAGVTPEGAKPTGNNTGGREADEGVRGHGGQATVGAEDGACGKRSGGQCRKECEVDINFLSNTTRV